MLNTSAPRTNQRSAALTAGLSLILMTAAAFFAYGFAHGKLVIAGNAALTVHNLSTSRLLFTAELLGWVIILICDILVAWGFYLYLKPIHQPLSLLGAWLRLIYSSILGAAIMNLFMVQLLLNRSDLLLQDSRLLEADVMLHLQAFETFWSVGLIMFGGHLLLVGLVALRSKIIPKGISLLLLLAAVGYMLVHLLHAFLPELDEVSKMLNLVFTLPMIAGELGFGLWLLFTKKQVL